MMSPVIDSMASEYKGCVIFVKVDIDQNQGLATAHDVRGVPHFQIWKKGKKVESFSGADKTQLSYLVQLHSADMEPSPVVTFTAFPITDYARSEAASNSEGLLKKLKEFNSSTQQGTQVPPELVLDDSPLGELSRLMASLSSKDYSFSVQPIHFEIIEKLSKWPASVRFPGLDIIRCFILIPAVSEHYQLSFSTPGNLITRLLDLLSAEGTSVADLRMLWRFAANCLASPALRHLLCHEHYIQLILTSMLKDVNLDKTLRMPLCDTLLNLIMALETSNKTDDVNFLLTKTLEITIRLMTSEKEENALCRLLVGLGTVIVRNPAFQVILCGNTHLKGFLSSKLTTLTVPFNVTAVNELLVLLEKPL